jgi:hypothetical protein
MDTYKQIKASFPVNIKDFILFNDTKGNLIPNFLLYYSETLNVVDRMITDSIERINKMNLPGDIYDKIDEYANGISDGQYQSYWLNIERLAKEIKSIIKGGGTSYTMSGCFDIVFKKVDAVIDYYKSIQAGYFDPYNGNTTPAALRELRNK